MEKWNSILFVKINVFILKVPSIYLDKNTLRTFAVAKNARQSWFYRWSPSCFRFRVWFPFYVIAGTEIHVVYTASIYLLESEPEASDFSGETSSSFKFSLSNSANLNEEELVSVDSTVEPYQFEPVGTALRTRWTRTAMSEYLLESEPEASDFSGETSSFEFSLSNSADSNKEELVSVDSTVEPYQFEPVDASTSNSHASDSDGDDGNTGNGRLESTNWYVYNGKDHPVQLFLCINRPSISLYIIIKQLHVI